MTHQPSDRKFWSIVGGPLLFALCVIWLFLSGCKSERRISDKAIRAMKKAERRYNGASKVDTAGASYCRYEHPVAVGKGKTVYLPGKKVVTHDTTTTTSYLHDTFTVTRIVTKYSHSVDTIRNIDTVVDTRTERTLTAQIDGLKKSEVNAWQREREAVEAKEKWRGRFFWSAGLNLFLILLIGVWVYWKYRERQVRKLAGLGK